MGSSVYIIGVGAALPAQVLSNEQILEGMPWLDTNPDWMREHTGICSRHVASPEEKVTDLAIQAAREALERAQVADQDTDMVILATNTSQFVYPSGAAIVQAGLAERGFAMSRATSFDLQQGCASFVAGIILAASMVQSGACRQVLVVGADVPTRMVDWTDRSSLLLGDGASACVLSDRPMDNATAPSLEILGSFMRTVPDVESIYQRSGLDVRNHPLQHIAEGAALGDRVGREQLYARLAPENAGGHHHHFHMDGRKVYRFVRRTVPGSGFHEVLLRAGLITEDEFQQVSAASRSSSGNHAELRADIGRRIDRFVPHGANMALDQELADQMCIPYDRMALTLHEHGNTSAASVGIALDRILRGSLRYETVAKRDGDGKLTRPSREILVDPLRAGHSVLMVSFGAGTSWNYIAARAV